jgi:hypothetical protein
MDAYKNSGTSEVGISEAKQRPRVVGSILASRTKRNVASFMVASLL